MIKLKIDIKKKFLKRRFNTSFFAPTMSNIFWFSKGVQYIIFSPRRPGISCFPPRGPGYHHFFEEVKYIILFPKETKFLLLFIKGAQYIIILSSFSLRRPSISCFYPRGSSIFSFFQGGRVYHPFLQGNQVPPLYPTRSSIPCFFQGGQASSFLNPRRRIATNIRQASGFWATSGIGMFISNFLPKGVRCSAQFFFLGFEMFISNSPT